MNDFSPWNSLFTAGYPTMGVPGITYLWLYIDTGHEQKVRIDCLLLFNSGGDLMGVLHRYPEDSDDLSTAVDILVSPHAPSEVLTQLWEAACERWGGSLREEGPSDQGIGSGGESSSCV
jgi:hypothetical protein